jgi:hypothetical protein
MQPSKRVPVTKSDHAVANEIARAVGETEKAARKQLWQIVRFCGQEFARDILTQTLEIEARGGMQTNDGLRRRTPGGVYFHLAYAQMPSEVRRQLQPSQRQKYKQSARYQQRQRALSEAMPAELYQRYEELLAIVSHYQSLYDLAKQGRNDTDPETCYRMLVSAQRELSVIEQEYDHIFQQFRRPKRGAKK